MGLSNYEKETIILFNEDEDTASVQTFNPKLKRKFDKFAKEYPDLCKLEMEYEQGGASYVVDKSRLSINLTRPFTEEQKERAREQAHRNLGKYMKRKKESNTQ